MGAQCHFSVGAQLDAWRSQRTPVAPSPFGELGSVGRTSKSGRTCATILDLAGATHTACASAVAPLRVPRLTPGYQPQSIFLRSQLPTCLLSHSWPSPLYHRRSTGRNLQVADLSPTADISVEVTEEVDTPNDNVASVYLYIPNIIGYMRILMNFVAFTLCFTNRKLFVVLYFISFVLDGLDGWFARRLNQVSTLGAAMDMVTDRISTTCLLVILSHIYSPALIFLSLLALDIASHWLQMYSTLISGKDSHKDIHDSASWLLKAYYRNRLFMGLCCVGSEVVYITLFLLAEKQPESMITVVSNTMKQGSLHFVPFLFALLGWAIKQAVNILQMKMAADACVLYDMMKRC